MTDLEISGENGIVAKADAKAIKRAQWEAFEFELEAPGLVRVTNGSHADPENHSYVVNVENGVPVVCQCKADQYHDGPCKHRVAVAIREPVLEAAGSIGTTPEPALATDGGVILEEPESDEENEDIARADDRNVRLEANRIATEAVANADGPLADFDVFCVTVELTTDSLLRFLDEK